MNISSNTVWILFNLTGNAKPTTDNARYRLLNRPYTININPDAKNICSMVEKRSASSTPIILKILMANRINPHTAHFHFLTSFNSILEMCL